MPVSVCLRAQSYAERLRLGLAVMHGEAHHFDLEMADSVQSPPFSRSAGAHTGLELPGKTRSRTWLLLSVSVTEGVNKGRVARRNLSVKHHRRICRTSTSECLFAISLICLTFRVKHCGIVGSVVTFHTRAARQRWWFRSTKEKVNVSFTWDNTLPLTSWM